MLEIKLVTIEDLDQLAVMFNQYRVFYKQESNIEAAKIFLKERVSRAESTTFIALYNNKAVGFTQLYPMFSSVSMQKSYVLNDLFVDSGYRQKGIGEALLNRAKEFCKSNKAKGLTLETATDNPAQKLYEKLGWKKDMDCFHYFWINK